MRVGVHGSYYGYNFGDTLLCRIFNSWVQQSDLVEDTVLPLANAKNQKAIGAQYRGILQSMQADAIIMCGGGYFSESTSNSRAWTARVYWRHLWLSAMARKFKKPLAIYGVGVGPVSNAGVRKRILATFEYAHSVVVRDEESAKMLKDWGMRREVRVASDAVVGVDLRQLVGLAARTHSPSRPQKLIVHSSGRPSELEMSAVRTICEWATSRPNVEIVFATDGLSRQRAIEWPRKVGAAFPHIKHSVRMYDGDVDAMVRFLATADAIATTKLHVGIVGMNLGVPVISIPQHAKTRRFFLQAGKLDHVVDQGNATWPVALNQLLCQWEAGSLSGTHRLPTHNAYPQIIEQFLQSVGSVVT